MTPGSLPPFHLAFPVRDLAEARGFYGAVLGCPEGRSSEAWVDFDFFGHQLVAHWVPSAQRQEITNAVDGDLVPIPHFGVILDPARWNALARRLTAAQVPFILEPKVRFKDRPGEQSTMVVLDPFGNALEFKSFADSGRIFEK